MPTAMDVANYFLATLGSDEESDLTNMKMQKLCAYAQGLSLALLDRPLYEDELEAWQHGPVIPALYDIFKENGRNPIPYNELSEKYARMPFDDQQKFIIELARQYYGSKATPVLRNMSHQDFPGLFGSKYTIEKGAIKESFLKLPLVRKLKDYTPLASGDGELLSESEFWDAFSVYS